MERRGLFLYLLLLVGVFANVVQGSVVESVEDLSEEVESYNVIPPRCREKSMSKVQCAGLSDDRLMAHPDDCQLFYYCVGETSICRECPDGLHFNPLKHVCDHPDTAGCHVPPSSD